MDICPYCLSIGKPSNAVENGSTFYCAVCHDALGTGNGKIVERGYLPAAVTITRITRAGFERRGIKVLLRDVPVGYFFEVIIKRLRRHARLCQPDPAGRPLGDHRLCPRPAVEPVRPARGPAEKERTRPGKNCSLRRSDREQRDRRGDEPGVRTRAN